MITTSATSQIWGKKNTSSYKESKRHWGRPALKFVSFGWVAFIHNGSYNPFLHHQSIKNWSSDRSFKETQHSCQREIYGPKSWNLFEAFYTLNPSGLRRVPSDQDSSLCQYCHLDLHTSRLFSNKVSPNKLLHSTINKISGLATKIWPEN
jgi:hypothetical protein